MFELVMIRVEYMRVGLKRKACIRYMHKVRERRRATVHFAMPSLCYGSIRTTSYKQ